MLETMCYIRDADNKVADACIPGLTGQRMDFDSSPCWTGSNGPAVEFGFSLLVVTTLTPNIMYAGVFVRDHQSDATLTVNLIRAHRLVRQSLETLLRKEGLTVEQWRVLERLSQGGGLPMGDVAKHAFLNPPAMSKLADKMVQDGLIHRLVDPEDQRRILIHLTDRGRSLSTKAAMRVDEHNRILMKTLSPTKAVALTALLEDFVNMEFVNLDEVETYRSNTDVIGVI